MPITVGGCRSLGANLRDLLINRCIKPFLYTLADTRKELLAILTWSTI